MNRLFKKSFISAFVIFLLAIISPSIISAASIDNEISKVTHYAEEYEIGNINYIKLLLYTSSIRQTLNELLGAAEKNEGGVLKQDQIREALGEPNEETRWVWVEREEREKRLDNVVPIWRKIIFDGKELQIRISAYPSIFSKESPELKKQINDLRDQGKFEEAERLKRQGSGREGTLIYRLNFEYEFKKPKEQLDIQNKIENIKSLAEIFNSDPSSANANVLAKESVNVERAFNIYVRQNNEKCDDVMKSIFGSENQREEMGMIIQEIYFYEKENTDIIVRLEMCDECQYNWINLDIRTETRGPGMQQNKEEPGDFPRDEFKNLNFEDFEREIREALEDYKTAVDSKDFQATNRIKQRIWALNQAWNEKSNDLWKQVEENFVSKKQTLTEKEMQGYYENYGWIKEQQEKRNQEKELRKANYDRRKQFYLNLFKDYEKKESFSKQKEYEKRLIEEFKEFGQEICDNNQDDNGNEQIDCADAQCGGKICGKQKVEITEGNETKEVEKELYCINQECQIREEIIEMFQSICGNHICEEEEQQNCTIDCTQCQIFPAINCSGRVIFSGNDENNCPLEPICVEESDFCQTKEDCQAPLCGSVDCVENKCQLIALGECQETQCVEGQERVIHCDTGEDLITGICVNGLWNNVETQCPNQVISQEEVAEQEIVGNECSVRSDCGGQNDVCSNGRCVTLPQSIPIEPTEPEAEELEQQEEQPGIQGPGEEEQPETQGQQDETQERENLPEPEQSGSPEESTQTESETPVTGGVIFNFIRNFFTKLTITGNPIEDSDGETNDAPIESQPTNNQETDNIRQEAQQQDSENENWQIDNQGPQQEFQQENEGEYRDDGREEDRKNREQQRGKECEDRCNRECYDMKVRPCVEKCIMKECGDELECNVDELKNKCEEECKGDEFKSCIPSCNEKCLKGEQTWEESKQEDQHKEEKGVFMVGGGCRTSQGKTEAFMWFGGWGEPFKQLEPLKSKYYSGGEADWCKWDYENLKKQRKKFEEGFNQEFVAWFFEKYLANSAENWEQEVSGIFELYWKDVDNSRELAYRMKCLGLKELSEYNLINVKYESEYGSIEFWEEIKTAKLPGEKEEMSMITPYMKIWVFPNKEFIKYEMKKSMKEHRFPGPPENNLEKDDGLSEEERNMIRQDKEFMEKVEKLSEKYGGSFDGALQIIDSETTEIIFNLYVRIDRENILEITPMLPEELSEIDATVQVDFEKVYELILMSEKEMAGARIESPPWDRQGIKPVQKIKDVTNGIKMYFKVRNLINSAEITPDSSEKDVQSMIKEVMGIMMKGDGGGKEDEEKPDEEGEGFNKEGFDGGEISEDENPFDEEEID